MATKKDQIEMVTKEDLIEMATKEDPIEMATKEDSIQLDYYTSCLPCLEAERVTEAIRYCVECKSHLCEQCLHDHNKFASLRKHKVVNKSEVAEHLAETDQAEANTAIECGSHYGQYIYTFCKDHNEVCCNVCLTIKHRSCKQTEKIQNIAKGIKESNQFTDTKLSLEQFLVFANQEKVDRKKNLTSLDEQKIKILSDIDKFEKDIIRRTRENAETSRENIKNAHAKHEKAVKSDVKELDTVMSGLKECLNRLNQTNLNEVVAFVSVKNCLKTLAEVKVVVNDLSDKWQQTELYYKFNNQMIYKNIAFGDVIEEEKKDTVYHLTSKGTVKISNKTHIRTFKIKGICLMADGTYVVTDSYYNNIMRLNENLEVTDFLKFDSYPESICVTGPKEVAVTFPEKNMIQFVTIDEKMSLGPSFSTVPGCCTAINYDSREERLYVCCTYIVKHDDRKEKCWTLSVHGKNGTLLTTFERDCKGQIALLEPEQIIIETERILVLDKKLETVIFKKVDDGTLEHVRKNLPTPNKQRSQYIYQSLNSKCLCRLSNTFLLSLPDYSYCNLKLSLNSMDGKTTKSLQTEISSKVLAAVFNKQRSTLVLAGESNKITEYKVPLKILKLLV